MKIGGGQADKSSEKDDSQREPSTVDTGVEVSKERETLLVNEDVQSMVQKMVDQGVYLITPKLDASGLSYPAVGAVFPDRSGPEIEEFLTRLASVGILRSKLLDKVIVCPTCGSPSVYSKYNCPRCSSFDIGKASIIEHIRCGYIGSKEKFQKKGQLICPKCKNVVSEVDYRKIGASFECNSCGSRFEAPRMSHKCNSCDDVFTYKEARYEPIFEFELSEDTKRTVAKGTLPLGTIVSTLKENGYEVGLKRDLTGKSGATHNFDIVAKKGSALVVANFTFEPKEEDIIGLFAKKYDVDPTFTLLVALTPPSKEEEAVSKAYGVMILSSQGARSIGDQIVDLVNAYFEESEKAEKEKKREEEAAEERRRQTEALEREAAEKARQEEEAKQKKEAEKAERAKAEKEKEEKKREEQARARRKETVEKQQQEEEVEEPEPSEKEEEAKERESAEKETERPRLEFVIPEEDWEQYDF